MAFAQRLHRLAGHRRPIEQDGDLPLVLRQMTNDELRAFSAASESWARGEPVAAGGAQLLARYDRWERQQ